MGVDSGLKILVKIVIQRLSDTVARIRALTAISINDHPHLRCAQCAGQQGTALGGPGAACVQQCQPWMGGHPQAGNKGPSGQT